MQAAVSFHNIRHPAEIGEYALGNHAWRPVEAEGSPW